MYKWSVVLTVLGMVSHPLVTVAAEPDNPVIADLARRIEELEHKDVLRAEELDYLRARDLPEVFTRITELKDRIAKDVEVMTSKFTQLEGLHAKHLLDMTTSMMELNERHSSDVLQMTKSIQELENIRSKDAQVISKLTKEVAQLRSGQTIVPPSPNAYASNAINNSTDITSLDMDTSKTRHLQSEAREMKHASVMKLTKPSAGIVKSNVPLTNIIARGRRVGPTTETIAFHAYLDHTLIDPGTQRTIVFEHIMTNVNAQYNPHSGVFTCTRPGVHVFWQIRPNAPNWIETELVKNGAFFANSFVGDKILNTAGSATAAVDLTVGDEVWIRVSGRMDGADIIACNTMCTGFRIQ